MTDFILPMLIGLGVFAALAVIGLLVFFVWCKKLDDFEGPE